MWDVTVFTPDHWLSIYTLIFLILAFLFTLVFIHIKLKGCAIYVDPRFS